MGTKQDELALAEKLEKHPGGPIQLTQEECWTIGTMMERMETLANARQHRIEKALEILETAIREAVWVLRR